MDAPADWADSLRVHKIAHTDSRIVVNLVFITENYRTNVLFLFDTDKFYLSLKNFNEVTMSKIIKIYENRPDYKAISGVVESLERGAIIIFPTDSFYSYGCSLSNTKAVNKLIALTGKSNKNLSIMCKDLTMVSGYVNLNDSQFKILRQNTPNPITFLFEMNKRLPNSFFDQKKSLGVRIPSSAIAMELIEQLGAPIVCSTVSLKNATMEESADPSLIWDEMEGKVDILIDGGHAVGIGTMVVDMREQELEIIRDNENISLIL